MSETRASILIMIVMLIAATAGCTPSGAMPSVAPTQVPPTSAIPSALPAASPLEMPATIPAGAGVCPQDGSYQSATITADPPIPPLHFNYYLPPCYEQQHDARYPVLYLLHGAGGSEYTWNTANYVEQNANALIHKGRIPPLIVVMPRHLDGDEDHDGDLFVQYLIPYVDANFRTRAERQYRVVGGASYGGMMSVRMAFKNPGLFGRVGIFGHGLSHQDVERLATWIDQTPPEQWPPVLIDIGYHDPGMEYGERLIEQLEAKHVPYLLLREEGRHSYDYWFSHLPFYLEWYATDWLADE